MDIEKEIKKLDNLLEIADTQTERSEIEHETLIQDQSLVIAHIILDEKYKKEGKKGVIADTYGYDGIINQMNNSVDVRTNIMDGLEISIDNFLEYIA